MIDFIKSNSVGIFSVLLTIFLYIFGFKPKFDFSNSFENSPNDSSIKLKFSITNLSNQAKRIDRVILYKGNEVIKDNGYSYIKVEDDNKKKAEENKKRIEARKKKIAEANMRRKEEDSSQISLQEALGKNSSLSNLNKAFNQGFDNKFLSDDIFKVEDPLKDFKRNRLNEKYSSSNFKKSRLLTKDTGVNYSYWVNVNEVPDKVKIISTNRINWFKKSKIFKVNKDNLCQN